MLIFNLKIMVGNKAIKYLKKNDYTFEEIEWIKLWLEQSNQWKVISKKEMNSYIKKELFSKYTTNV